MTVAPDFPERAGAVPAILAIAAAAAAVAAALPLPPACAALAVGLYLLATAAILSAAGQPPRGRFGLANTLTLARLAGAAVFAGFALAPAPLAGSGGWLAAAAAAALLALDGIDGWIARRQGLASDFGARLDMETDALTILVLAALALALGKAGAWILLLGALRYLFVLAGRGEPRLAAPLPPSFRRKAVCVLQIAILAALLAPAVAPPVSQALAAVALAALVWSFAVDVRFLLRARP